jgi:mycothiol synthase
VTIETTPGPLPALSIPGVRLRHLRPPDDYRAMNAIANAVRAAEGSDWATGDEEFQNFYEHLSNCDPDRDVFIAEEDGRMVGYARGAWAEDAEGLRTYEPVVFVDPSQELPGLRVGLHEAIEGHLRRIAAGHPPGPKVFQTEADDTAVEREAMLRAAGYEAVRHGFLMVRPTLDDLPDAPLPPGIEIREVRPEQMRAIWDGASEAFRDEWGWTAPTEAQYEQWLTDPLNDPALWRIAWDGDEVVGQVRSYINAAENEIYGRARGWVENISVRRPWRRRGLARALIAASFPLLRARGMTEGALTVDTENPSGALRLYERCGFVALKRNTIYRRRLE